MALIIKAPQQSSPLPVFDPKLGSAFSKETSIFLGAKKALIGDQEFRVYFNMSGKICATIHSGDKSINNLPVEGVPTELLVMRNAALLTRFFTLVKLQPKKNVNGTYRCLKVHVPGPGGVKAKIPFQPGLAIGSIVPYETIRQLDQYATAAAKMESIEQQIQAIRDGIVGINAKLEAYQADEEALGAVDGAPGLVEIMQPILEAQKGAFIKQGQLLAEKVREATEELGAVDPIFPKFRSGLKLPLDLDRTTMGIDPRGFDSITFSSRLIDVEESEERIRDKLNESSSSSQVSGEVSGGWFVKVKAGFSHSWSKAAMDRVASIRRQGTASKILLVNAMVTSRNVRYLKNKHFDLKELQALLEVMRAGSPETKRAHGISTVDGQQVVYYLSEAVMGGSFTAIVTYLKKSEQNRDLEEHTNTSSSATEANAGGSFLGIGGSLSGSNAQESTESTSDDHLKSADSLNINIDFICQGAIPQLARDTVVREVMKYQDQNFQTHESNGSEGSGKSRVERQAELQEAMYKAANAIAKTQVDQSELSVHTPGSVSKAYDDFCGEITGDNKSGVPIGFNYSTLTEREILQRIGELQGNVPTE